MNYQVVFKQGTGVAIINEAVALAKKLGAGEFTFYVDDRLLKSRLVRRGVARKSLSEAPQGLQAVNGLEGMQEMQKAISAYQRLLEVPHKGEAESTDFDELKAKPKRRKPRKPRKPRVKPELKEEAPAESVGDSLDDAGDNHGDDGEAKADNTTAE